MRKYLFLIVLLSLMILVAGCQNETGQADYKELKLAHNQALDHPVHLSLTEFGRLVEEKSNGEIRVEVFPNGQLGSEREVIELTQTGAVDVSKVSASALEGFSSDYSIFSLPYVFESYEEFEHVMDKPEIADRIYHHTEDIGFIGLTYYSAGMRNLYTKDREVTDVSDMEGLKVRVQPSETSVSMIEAFGGIPTAMAFGEVYTALQSGVIDAAENNETSLVGNNHGEVAKYYMYTEHQVVPDMLIMNADRFNQFTAEEQALIQEAADESSVYHKDVWAKAIEDQTKTAKEEMGVKFVEVDKTSFIESVKPLHEAFATNEETKEIYQLIMGGKTDE